MTTASRMTVARLRALIAEAGAEASQGFFYGCQRYPNCDATAQGQRPHRLGGSVVRGWGLMGSPAPLDAKGRPTCPVCKLPMRKMKRSAPQAPAQQTQQEPAPQPYEPSRQKRASKQPEAQREPPEALVQLVDRIKARDLRYFDEAALQRLSRTFKVPDWQMFRWLRALGLEPRQQELF